MKDFENRLSGKIGTDGRKKNPILLAQNEIQSKACGYAASVRFHTTGLTADGQENCLKTLFMVVIEPVEMTSKGGFDKLNHRILGSKNYFMEAGYE